MGERIIKTEKQQPESYVIPRGRWIYQITVHNNLMPGKVMEPFRAKIGEFSSHLNMTEFRSTELTKLIYGKQERNLHPGTRFYTEAEGLTLSK